MITLKIPTAEDFWKALCLFAYRRWAKPREKKPVGVPGNRDPDFPCSAYEPLPRSAGLGWDDCQTDGHYLCDECCHKAPKTIREEDEDEC